MKALTDTQYIQQLVSEGEHCHQDFKFEISDARKIARSLSAFANTEGGRLLVGVKDNGKIAGIRSEEEIYMIEAAATLYCRPAVDLKTQATTWKGKMYWKYASTKCLPNRCTRRMRRTNPKPISESKTRIFLPPPYILKYGNILKRREGHW